MDGAVDIPKNAIAILSLCQNQFSAGAAAILFNKSLRVFADMAGDDIDIGCGYERAAISLTTITAFLACKQILRISGVRWHGGSPWLFSGLPDRHI
jgi:hypothetical protein